MVDLSPIGVNGSVPVGRLPQSFDLSRGVSLIERSHGLSLLITARKGKISVVAARMQAALGLLLPMTPKLVSSGAVCALWSGLGQWLVMALSADAEAVEAKVRDVLCDLAAIVDQSHAQLRFALAGPRVNFALEKLVGIDLHASTFPENSAAMTAIAHVPVHIWRGADVHGFPCFEIAGPRSYADCLRHHLETATIEYQLGVAGGPTRDLD